MLVSEFKAWFDGFSDGITDAPTKEQWAKIKSKIEDVQPQTETHYVRGDHTAVTKTFHDGYTLTSCVRERIPVPAHLTT